MPYRELAEAPGTGLRRRLSFALGGTPSGSWAGDALLFSSGVVVGLGVAAISFVSNAIAPFALMAGAVGLAWRAGVFRTFEQLVLDLDALRLHIIKKRRLGLPERFTYDLRVVTSFDAEVDDETGIGRGRIVAPYPGGTMVVYRGQLNDCERIARVLDDGLRAERERLADSKRRSLPSAIG